MTLTEAVVPALVMGLLGSLHCTAMCGPLVVAGCGGADRGRSAAGYFAGRLVAYATVGAVMGHLGRHAMCILPVGAAQGIAVALTALPAAARGLSLVRPRRLEPLVPFRRSRPRAAFAFLGSLLPRRGLGLGLATGVLPCGLLAAAWALAASTSDPVLGALVMASLSVATLPGLLVPLVGRRIASGFALRISPRVQGLLWCGLAAWLALRPLFVQAHCAA